MCSHLCVYMCVLSDYLFEIWSDAAQAGLEPWYVVESDLKRIFLLLLPRCWGCKLSMSMPGLCGAEAKTECLAMPGQHSSSWCQGHQVWVTFFFEPQPWHSVFCLQRHSLSGIPKTCSDEVPIRVIAAPLTLPTQNPPFTEALKQPDHLPPGEPLKSLKCSCHSSICSDNSKMSPCDWHVKGNLNII